MRSTDQCGREGDALKLAARKRLSRAAEKMGDAERQARLLDCTGARGRGLARDLERQLELPAHRRSDHLRFRVLCHEANGAS